VTEPGLDTPLSRTAASEAVQDIGWRYLLGTLSASVPVRSLKHASEVAAAALAASGQDADDHLRIDLRPDRVELSVQTRVLSAVTGRDTQLARRITDAVGELGLCPEGATSGESPRPVQMLEMAIDALDIAAIRPFWKAVMAYADEPGRNGPQDAIVDPAGQLPAIWFSKWAPRAHRATGCTSISRWPTTRPRPGSAPRWPPAVGWSTIPLPGRSGSSPMPRATKCASAPGPTATSGSNSDATRLWAMRARWLSQPGIGARGALWRAIGFGSCAMFS